MELDQRSIIRMVKWQETADIQQVSAKQDFCIVPKISFILV